MQVNLKWKLTLLVLLVLALVIASYQLMRTYVEQQSQAIEQQRNAAMEWVLVFKRDLEEGHMVTLDDLQQRKYPPGYISEDWLRPQDAMAIVGNLTQHFVSRGEPVMLAVLQQARRASFSDVLAHNEYAVTATISIEQVHHGLLAIGNRVSLVAQRDSFGEASENTLMSIANVEILAIDNVTEADWQQGLASTLTFRFTAAQAAAFEQIRRSGYAIWLQNPEPDYAPLKAEPVIKIYTMNNGGFGE
ncbi:hypothetical protein [Pseudidiomarina terrestris]|uniref:Flp pilus assembly protein CpaB n=1 Tax=Pseudidiomarina terrestris TaxID=2820060 RepID=A0AAW7R5B4_9GAMM|nr:MULTISPECIES: hypothetical protein [unclassified Pseudidiomarina]MDN7125704.1 hypothetical protein [Pseudidiomarina sp. 1APP75-32.1]MDN7128148.1 hypothetical protein [Pseudidiomarina sp. 1APR75-33.1]MDN7136569.1 hypothetical protein [Pseudidiomarina sp. 1ASP75-5]MDN7138917.1 hypothetical protein [Pseudidiomarina sp. 1ASP75-14]